MNQHRRTEALPPKDRFKNGVKSALNVHRPDGSPNVFLFSMPRSGSTWAMELIGDQPGFKTCSEPLNLRLPLVRSHLGMADWRLLHDDDAEHIITSYFRRFCDGTLHFLDPLPLRGHPYRFRSTRIVFKVLHGAEERINVLRDACNGRVAYLLRHPIAVSLSHEVLPRLDAYVDSTFARNFRTEQISFARRVIADGTELERGVLAWCFENAIPLRSRTPDWTVFTYEQLVLDPLPVVAELARALELGDPGRMQERLTIASAVKSKSDARTRRLLDSDDRDVRASLADKWRGQVSEAATRSAMDILPRFGITAYGPDGHLPAADLWIRS